MHVKFRKSVRDILAAFMSEIGKLCARIQEKMAACLYRPFRFTMIALTKNRNLIMNCISDRNKLLSTPVWLVSLNFGRFKGHSHWQNIKNTKQKADKAFSRVVSFYARKINQSVRGKLLFVRC